MHTEDDTFTILDLIRTQSRDSAIAERLLIDVTHEARRHGITQPTALSGGVWECCVRVREDTTGRTDAENLASVLFALGEALKATHGPIHPFVFSVEAKGHGGQLRVWWLTVVGGPDDDGDPCLTVLFESEC